MTLGGEQSREISCNSMAYFPASGSLRLVQVRALQGDFPYYGTLETLPATASEALRTGWQAVVDAGLLLQFEAQIGDPIKIGTQTLTIAGGLHKDPRRGYGCWPHQPARVYPHGGPAAADLCRKAVSSRTKCI